MKRWQRVAPGQVKASEWLEVGPLSVLIHSPVFANEGNLFDNGLQQRNEFRRSRDYNYGLSGGRASAHRIPVPGPPDCYLPVRVASYSPGQGVLML